MNHWTITTWAALSAAGIASAQSYIQQGNVLDANPMVGSAGLNTATPVYNPNAANRIISGNVTGGASFRGFSPIRSTNSLFLGSSGWGAPLAGVGAGSSLFGSTPVLSSSFNIPSANLSDFTRDSTAVSDLSRRGMVGGSQAYYPTASTVANVGAIVRGLNRPGSSEYLSPYMTPPNPAMSRGASPLLPDDLSGRGRLLNVPTTVVRADTGQPVGGPVNPRLLASPLFAGVREVPLNALSAEVLRGQGGMAASDSYMDARARGSQRLDGRVEDSALRFGADRGSPLDRMLAGRLTDGSMKAPDSAVRDVEQFNLDTGPKAAANTARTDRLSGTGDIYGSMLAATGQMSRDEPARGSLIVGQGGEGAEAASPGGSLVRNLNPAGGQPEGEAEESAAAEPDQQQRAILAVPLRSFAGTEESAVNRYLADAEAHLHAGDYYRAAGSYDLARTVDPTNPLPLVGRSLALLAAGDYLSSASSLFSGIARFESLAHFQVDLKAFIPDVVALDRRRADLERWLEKTLDARLEFLLGFAEYSSDLKDLGITHMDQAAGKLPDQPALRRYVDALKGRPVTVEPPTDLGDRGTGPR